MYSHLWQFGSLCLHFVRSWHSAWFSSAQLSLNCRPVEVSGFIHKSYGGGGAAAFLIFQTNSHVSIAACQFWFCDSFIIKCVRLQCSATDGLLHFSHGRGMAVCVWEKKTDVRLHMCMFSSHQGRLSCPLYRLRGVRRHRKTTAKVRTRRMFILDVLFNRSAWFLHQNVPAVSVLWKLADFFLSYFFPKDKNEPSSLTYLWCYQPFLFARRLFFTPLRRWFHWLWSAVWQRLCVQNKLSQQPLTRLPWHFLIFMAACWTCTSTFNNTSPQPSFWCFCWPLSYSFSTTISTSHWIGYHTISPAVIFYGLLGITDNICERTTSSAFSKGLLI